MNIDLSICIITYNRPQLLRACLAAVSDCLNRSNSFSYEIVVSDDSQQQSAYPIVSRFNFARWVQGPSRGVASNRNNVSKAAIGNWILFIDDDELPDPDWVYHMYSMISVDKWDVIEGRVQPISYPDNILWYAPVIKSGGAFCTANLAIRRSFFLSIGGFNENYNVSHEDVELGQRILSTGASTLYYNKAVVFHPARCSSFVKVFNRFIDLQCQSYRCQLEPPYTFSFPSLSFLFTFCLKYWFRVSKIEFNGRHDGQWLRPVQASLLLLITIPIASYRLLLMHLSQAEF